MMNLPLAGAAQARTAALVRALRDVEPKLPDFDIERIALAAAGGAKPLAGWSTHHEPEERRYSVQGTICDVPVTQTFVAGYDDGPSLSEVGVAAVNAARRITDESLTDVLLNGRRRWSGPMG